MDISEITLEFIRKTRRGGVVHHKKRPEGGAEAAIKSKGIQQ